MRCAFPPDVGLGLSVVDVCSDDRFYAQRNVRKDLVHRHIGSVGHFEPMFRVRIAVSASGVGTVE